MRTRRLVVLLCGAVVVSCSNGPPERPERPSTAPVEVGPQQLGKADGFDWGNGCQCGEGGEGSFTQSIAHNAVVNVGTIPVGMVDVMIKLEADEDVDIQLYDGEQMIVGYPDGLLAEDGRQSTTYNGVTVTYSGYNGDGENLGHEYIKIEGMNLDALTMKAYGYAAGNARVEYSWADRRWCGYFKKQVQDEARVTLGEIPAGLKDVVIELKSPVDIDIELYDGNTKVVGWDGGVVESDGQVSGSYRGVTVEWSGYNGDQTESGKGNEYIKISGTTQNQFKMKVYGYDPGTAKVFYRWEESETDPPEPYLPFNQRLASFAQRYADRVVIAERRGDPVLFLKTADFNLGSAAGREQASAFYTALYKLLGANALMMWNPSQTNMGHVAMGISDNPVLDDRFKGRAMQAYNTFHVYDMSLGNMDSYCYGDHTDTAQGSTVRYYADPCKKPSDVSRQRTVVAIKLTNAQLADWNSYLSGMASDFRGAVGNTRCGGGVPPFVLEMLTQGEVDDLELSDAETGSHNCTSWFTSWTFARLGHTMYYNPADMLRGYWGYWGDAAPSNLRAWLVFNHPDTPDAGAELPADFALQYGY